jgi:hypothetical protein
MTEPSPTDGTAKSVKRLSLAVWILAMVVAANLIVSILALLSPALLTKRIMATLPEHFASSQSPSPEDYNSLHDWPVEKQIALASVIAVGKWRKSDSTLRCIISEILKQAPNTTFYYKVGDEFRPGNQRVKDDTSYGDGQIMFFVGSPASFRCAMSFSGDRIAGMGDMPISELRELIRKPAQ